MSDLENPNKNQRPIPIYSDYMDVACICEKCGHTHSAMAATSTSTPNYYISSVQGIKEKKGGE